jgi:uncharacterized OsmC-like protein
MMDKIIVLQSNSSETFFWTPDPQTPEPDDLRPVEQIDALTPNGMLLASLGSCTAATLHTYAQHHGLDLEYVELHLQYGDLSAEGRESNQENGNATGQIEEKLFLYGELSKQDHERLISVAHQCTIHRMLLGGMYIKLGEENAANQA